MYYISTANQTTVVLDGVPFTVASDNPQYAAILQAIKDADAPAVKNILSAKERIQEAFGDVVIHGGHVTYKGHEIGNYLIDKILAGPLDIEPLARFLNNVLQNPSYRAVRDLYQWCEKAKMPLTKDGCIIAYKVVTNDFLDVHSKTFDNSPGSVVTMPRNEVNEDPEVTCSHGLHFCSSEYLPNFGPQNKKIVLVKVNPADVVAFPTDYNLSKARCCKYEVIQEVDGAQLFPEHDYFEAEPSNCYLYSLSSGLYWKARHDGYTDDLAEAHKYTQSEAKYLANLCEEDRVVIIKDGDTALLYHLWDNHTDAYWTHKGLDWAEGEEPKGIFSREKALEFQGVLSKGRLELIPIHDPNARFIVANEAGLYFLAPGQYTTVNRDEAYRYSAEQLRPFWLENHRLELA